MKIICIGRNYVKHIEELGNEVPTEPIIFLKPDTSILNRNRPFFIPSFSSEIHYEAEIVVRICRLGKNIPLHSAHLFYKEYTLGIDFTARDLQNKLKENGLPWEKAKGFDSSAALGTFLPLNGVEIQNTGFKLELNGNVVQHSNTSNMMRTVDELISYVSQFYTLKTGDLIFTGTPSGVGKVNKNDKLTGYIKGEKVFDFWVK